MGTTGPWRTAFGSTQGACADHPPAGLGEPIIRGLFSVSAPFRDDVNSAHIDPSPTPQGFALLGQALGSDVLLRLSENSAADRSEVPTHVGTCASRYPAGLPDGSDLLHPGRAPERGAGF